MKPIAEQLNTSELQKKISEIIFYDDTEAAGLLLKELKSQYGIKRIADLSLLTQEGVKTLLLMLMYVRFPMLSENDCIVLMKEHLLDALGINDLNFIEKLAKRIGSIQIEGEAYGFMRELVKAVRENGETLGNSEIIVDGKNVAPLVKNWIEDYLVHPTQKKYRENIEELEYVNRNHNTKLLSSDQQMILLNLLKIFDFLDGRVRRYYSTPETENFEQAFQDFDLYKMLPGLIFPEDLEMIKRGEGDKPELVNQGFIPKIEDGSQEGVVLKRDSNKKDQGANLSMKQVAVTQQPKKIPFDPPVIPRGPLDPEQYLAQKARARMVEIDKKIQDLKSRTGK